MPAYDGRRFDPPAPLAHVCLRNPENGAVPPEVPMLLDSGADVTLLEQDWGILGRNVRNAVAVLLDGPNLSWREQPDSRS